MPTEIPTDSAAGVEIGVVETRQLDRMLTYSDAVVAIAITLVVLPLVDAARENEGDTDKFFADNAYALLAAGVSFVAITVFWRAHHRVYSAARTTTAGITYVNALFLAAITFLPIATVLNVNSGGNERLSLITYTATVLAAVVSLRWGQLLTIRHDPTLRETRPLLRSAVPVGLAAGALVLCAAFPSLYLYPLWLIALDRPLLKLLS